MSNKNYYKSIDLLRIFSCICVFLYHLNILKGGYLLVCSFFVLSGYLTSNSVLKSENFNIKDYYKKRIIKLYIPLLIVVFFTTAIIPLFNNIHWFNLKPETTSVIFGYNNFWQINNNFDYFTQNISSPFIHMWYIAILIQYDLLFSLMCLGIKKSNNKHYSIITTLLITILSFIYFYINKNKTLVYYDSLTRLFSYSFGLFIGFKYHYFNNKTINNNIIKYLIFTIYLIIIITINIKPNILPLSINMILVTLITSRIIKYSIIKNSNNLKLDKIIKYISSISYEIYLFQYPIIFIFNYITIPYYLKILLIIFITILLSVILHFCLNNNKNKILSIIIISLIPLYGFYNYITAKDYTKEMNNLKKMLNQNEKLLETYGKEYKEKIQKEKEELNNNLNLLETDESKLKELIPNMPLIGIGDSVMLGAINNIKNVFPNSYVDAKISRSPWEAKGIIDNLKNNNMLGNPIIIHLGTNGDCSKECKIDIMNSLSDKQVFWINTTNYQYVNDNLLDLKKEYSNLEIIDWKSISTGHNEYFYADGIHLTEQGRISYTNAIYEAIYNNYLNKNKIKKEELINNYNKEQENRITFYGNTILLNSFDIIENNYQDASFIIDEYFTYQKLKIELENAKKNNTLTNKIVFLFDNNLKITKKEYQDLINICNDKKIYILNTNINNTTNIKFNYKNYLSPDGIHITKEGNNKLLENIINVIEKETS